MTSSGDNSLHRFAGSSIGPGRPVSLEPSPLWTSGQSPREAGGSGIALVTVSPAGLLERSLGGTLLGAFALSPFAFGSFASRSGVDGDHCHEPDQALKPCAPSHREILLARVGPLT